MQTTGPQAVIKTRLFWAYLQPLASNFQIHEIQQMFCQKFSDVLFWKESIVNKWLPFTIIIFMLIFIDSLSKKTHEGKTYVSFLTPI